MNIKFTYSPREKIYSDELDKNLSNLEKEVEKAVICLYESGDYGYKGLKDPCSLEDFLNFHLPRFDADVILGLISPQIQPDSISREDIERAVTRLNNITVINKYDDGESEINLLQLGTITITKDNKECIEWQFDGEPYNVKSSEERYKDWLEFCSKVDDMEA